MGLIVRHIHLHHFHHTRPNLSCNWGISYEAFNSIVANMIARNGLEHLQRVSFFSLSNASSRVFEYLSCAPNNEQLLKSHQRLTFERIILVFGLLAKLGFFVPIFPLYDTLISYMTYGRQEDPFTSNGSHLSL